MPVEEQFVRVHATEERSINVQSHPYAVQFIKRLILPVDLPYSKKWTLQYQVKTTAANAKDTARHATADRVGGDKKADVEFMFDYYN